MQSILSKRFSLNGLVLWLLLLSLVLVACGGEASPAPQNQSSPTAGATSAAPTGTVTNGPSFTPVALPTTAASATPGTVVVIDPNVKGELVIWEALPDNQGSFVKDQTDAFSKAYPGL